MGLLPGFCDRGEHQAVIVLQYITGTRFLLEQQSCMLMPQKLYFHNHGKSVSQWSDPRVAALERQHKVRTCTPFWALDGTESSLPE